MWPKTCNLGWTLLWTVLSSSMHPTRCIFLGTQSRKPAHRDVNQIRCHAHKAYEGLWKKICKVMQFFFLFGQLVSVSFIRKWCPFPSTTFMQELGCQLFYSGVYLNPSNRRGDTEVIQVEKWERLIFLVNQLSQESGNFSNNNVSEHLKITPIGFCSGG